MGFDVRLNRNVQKLLAEPYAFSVVDENRRRAAEKFGNAYILDFGVGDPTAETPPEVRAACRKAIDARKASGYPETLGHGAFREAVAKWFKRRFGVSLDASEVLATYGAKYSVFQLPSEFINPNEGEIALVPNPGYPPYSAGSTAAGAEIYYMNIVQEKDFLPDFQEIPADVAKRAKVLFLNSPHSPTGKIYPKEKLKEAVDFCIDNNIILISDECYSEIYFGERPMSILQVPNAEQCSIVVNSLSKRSRMTCYAAGCIACKNDGIMKALKSVQGKSVQGVASFIQDAAAVAFMDEKHVKEMNRQYREKMGVMVPALQEAGCRAEMPDGTFYIWAEIPANETPLKFAEELLFGKGINCTPGNLISREFRSLNPGAKFVRFALVPPLAKVKEAAKRLKK